jgi:hypothetical protein
MLRRTRTHRDRREGRRIKVVYRTQEMKLSEVKDRFAAGLIGLLLAMPDCGASEALARPMNARVTHKRWLDEDEYQGILRVSQRVQDHKGWTWEYPMRRAAAPQELPVAA